MFSQESVCCILPYQPLEYIAMHQLYSMTEWNWGETERLTPEMYFSLEYAALSYMTSQNRPRTQKHYMELFLFFLYKHIHAIFQCLYHSGS